MTGRRHWPCSHSARQELKLILFFWQLGMQFGSGGGLGSSQQGRLGTGSGGGGVYPQGSDIKSENGYGASSQVPGLTAAKAHASAHSAGTSSEHSVISPSRTCCAQSACNVSIAPGRGTSVRRKNSSRSESSSPSSRSRRSAPTAHGKS